MKPGTHSDRVLLEHILECIERILEYTRDERATFYDSRLIQDAVVRNLQTLAESTQRLSEAIKATENDVPWQAIAGFATYSCTLERMDSAGPGRSTRRGVTGDSHES